MEDLRAVLDAVGSERAVVFGAHDGGHLAALYAATYPERTEALVGFQFFAFLGKGDDPQWQAELLELRATWGTQELADLLVAETCPTLLRSEADRLWFANCMRVGASPEVGYELNKAFHENDLREVCAAIRVPTLLMYRGAVAVKEGARESAALI